MKNRNVPFIIATIINLLLIVAIIHTNSNPMMIFYIVFPAQYVLFSLAVFTCFCLEPVLSYVPFYKKVLAACVPFMLGVPRFQYWMMKELMPNTTYEQFLGQVDK